MNYLISNEKQCPYCLSKIKFFSKSHFKKCTNDHISKARYKYIVHNFPKVLKIDFKYLYLEKKYSLPDFKKELGLDYKSIQFLLDYYNIPKRGHKESCNLAETKLKWETTNLEKYKAKNVLCKGTTIYKKRNKTVNEKYGVSNVFQLQEVKDKINTPETSKKKSIASKRMWYNLSTEEYRTRLDNTIHSYEKENNKFVSKVEQRIGDSLSNIYEIDRQYNIEKFNVDIRVDNWIIEINGDFWHGHPDKYKKDDILNHPGTKNGILVESLWKKDKYRYDIILKNNFNLLVIWENFINLNTDIYVLNTIIKIIDENENKDKIFKEIR